MDHWRPRCAENAAELSQPRPEATQCIVAGTTAACRRADRYRKAQSHSGTPLPSSFWCWTTADPLLILERYAATLLQSSWLMIEIDSAARGQTAAAKFLGCAFGGIAAHSDDEIRWAPRERVGARFVFKNAGSTVTMGRSPDTFGVFATRWGWQEYPQGSVVKHLSRPVTPEAAGSSPVARAMFSIT